MNLPPAIVLGANAASSKPLGFEREDVNSLRLIAEMFASEHSSRKFVGTINLGANTFVMVSEPSIASGVVYRTPLFVGETVRTLARLLVASAAKTADSTIALADTLNAGVAPQAVRASNAILSEVYRLDGAARIDAAIDILFDRIDTLFCEGDFEACDRLLKSVDLNRLSVDVLVAILSITLAARGNLVERASLCRRAHARIKNERGAAATDALLKGLV